ncbi:unnamed protein product [Penicillium salamii]|uniref:Uncharacterized protein n=1 Tax=Penicillium salamii TaxID=1612424 RepID=A0A9W4N215_9EURO|nr:unnamed protein product [Penicillium salamii]CAG8157031.1 unnamed protein product [Penicillium salamii]CAG8236895.1 unnamed protein product [Penicillium salamii]CAG8260172.1 unnamed protein product [Penicillium salamii]CAG8380699.1 unnamed protein product [Penicillium salamii]
MDEVEGLIVGIVCVGIVFERPRFVRKCGTAPIGESGSERKLEREETIGEGGAELPLSVEGRPECMYFVDDARWSWGRSGSTSWKRRHDSRWRAIRDSRLSCGGMRDDGTGTMAPLGTLRRAEWRELRRLLGREAVLRDAEREWVIDAVEG